MDSEKAKDISEIVSASNDKLKRFIGFRVRVKEDAEDILQDVYYRLAESIDEIRSIDKITSWLYAVAKNRIADFFKKKRPVAESRLDSSKEGTLTIEDLFTELGAAPDDDFMRSEILVEIEDAIDLLPGDQREVFVMNEIEGLSFKEISAKTGTPVNTLLSRKRYAVIFLRDSLKELFNEINT